MNSDNLQVDSLDFDLIKSNLKEYLRGQNKFKDFDFEGSTMNILLDLLAYNTHYQAFYANMIANEAFLDSAVMRASAVSIGKHLGYVPRSIKASTNTIDIDLGSNSNLVDGVQKGLVYVFRGEIFQGIKEGMTVPFTALKNFKAEYVDSTVYVKNVEVYQGSLKSFSFVVNSFDPSQKFILPSTTVDVNSIVLAVQKSTKDTEGYTDTWFLSNDITKLDSGSRAYFLQETEDGKFEIYFGDGIVGKELQNGNVVTVEYLQTSGVNGNDCKTFTYSPSSTNTIMSRYTSSPICKAKLDAFGKTIGSYGGLSPESISSIKYYAPRHYQTQERAVTKDDYKTILSKEFIDTAESVFVWGGEENTPPEYGKVFVSIKPVGAKKLSTLEKLGIEKNVLSKKNMLTVIPKIVDPEYIYLSLDLTVRYNTLKAKISPTILETLVRSRIELFAANNLQQFGRDFRSSTFTSYIDQTNPMITSSSFVMKLQKRLEPLLGKSYPYTIKFDNELYHPIPGYPSILTSSVFGYTDMLSNSIVKPIVDAQLDEDGYGNVRVYKIVRSEKVYISNNIGTIDYTTGKIVLKNFSPQYSLPASTTEIYITVLPKADDIGTRRNDILIVDQSQIAITFSQDQTEIDNNQSGARFPY